MTQLSVSRRAWLGGAATLGTALLSRPGWAQGPASAGVERWGLFEVTLSSDASYANPFTDTAVTAEFRRAGARVRVPGFYAGSGQWKIRFMPEQAGTWTYRTRSADPALNGRTGRIAVREASGDNRGPIRVAKTYHLSYADGTPFFQLGTTSYNWINREAALQEQTLEALQQSPFNKVRFCLFPKWYRYNRVDPPEFPYVRQADGSFDLTRFNPVFFDDFENRLLDLQRLGIEADVILFHPYDNWGFEEMGPAADEAYLRYVTARFAAFRNVWWSMANEYDLVQPAKDWEALCRVVRDSDPYGHLLGVHNCVDWYDPGKPWVTHASLQDSVAFANGAGSAPRTTRIARQRHAKPILLDEYGYEGDNGRNWGSLTAREELSRHWGITMAGGYGTHGETYIQPGGIQFWGAGGRLMGDSPARLAFLKEVMTAMPFQDMEPAGEVVGNGTALGRKGLIYLFYFTNTPAAQIKLEGTRPYRIELIDPWLMKTYPLGYASPGEHAFAQPMTSALLRATAADAGTTSGAHEDVAAMLARFLGEPAASPAPTPARFEDTPLVYSVDYQVYLLEENPRTKAILERLLPGRTIPADLRTFHLRTALGAQAPNDGPTQVPVPEATLIELDRELNQIPVS